MKKVLIILLVLFFNFVKSGNCIEDLEGLGFIKELIYLQTGDWEKATNDDDFYIRELAYVKTGNWEKAENDRNSWLRKLAYIKTGNWEKATNDKDRYNRLSAYIQTGNWKKAENEEINWIKFFAYVQTDNWEKLKNETDVWTEELISLKSGNWKEAENHDESGIRRIAYVKTNNWEKAKKDKDRWIRAMAYIKTKDWQKAENDKDKNVRILAYIQTENWQKAEDDGSELIRTFAYLRTENWKKAENDKCLWIRRWAYVKTKNWDKVLKKEKDFIIREIAYAKLGKEKSTIAIKSLFEKSYFKSIKNLDNMLEIANKYITFKIIDLQANNYDYSKCEEVKDKRQFVKDICKNIPEKLDREKIAEKLAKAKLVIKKGKIYNSDGKTLHTSPKKTEMFIMNSLGEIFVNPIPTIGESIGKEGGNTFHTYFNKNSVTMAGEISIKKGRIIKFGNFSNYYRTDLDQVSFFLHTLIANKVKIKNLKFVYVTGIFYFPVQIIYLTLLDSEMFCSRRKVVFYSDVINRRFSRLVRKPGKRNYKTKKMLDHYKEEKKIIYLNREEREFYKLLIKNGKISNPLLLNKNEEMYVVMLKNGDIFGYQGIHPKYSHSTLVEGIEKEVAFAGSIQIEDGIIKYITNYSGHYRLNFDFTLQFMEELIRKKCIIKDIEYKHISGYTNLSSSIPAILSEFDDDSIYDDCFHCMLIPIKKSGRVEYRIVFERDRIFEVNA